MRVKFITVYHCRNTVAPVVQNMYSTVNMKMFQETFAEFSKKKYQDANKKKI